jgi:hypothetical protein
MQTKTIYAAPRKTQLIKKFHVLLGQQGIGAEGKEAILDSYNVLHTNNLEVYQLAQICQALENSNAQKHENAKKNEFDTWRKRVMGAIGGAMAAINYAADGDMIKRIACRASGYKRFNEIPLERLRSLYNAFLNQKKYLNEANKMSFG